MVSEMERSLAKARSHWSRNFLLLYEVWKEPEGRAM